MPSGGEATTVIGPDTHIKGEIVFSSAAKVLGKIDGQIAAQGRLEIGSGAVCQATIQATTLIVEGTVEGNVLARERLELTPTAIIKGDIVAAKLMVAEGATFSGQCTVGESAVRGHAPAEAPRAVRSAPFTPPTAATPTITTRPAASPDLEGALAGLESKLAGFAKAKALNGEH